ncbi:hypothetical protein NHX12_028837 [Muraenolepis orangiensis]|uniref:Uncharacterized protein n=1 Tax=Muraenolepis orangiensis TaxID=630683 RepID=A0A9Q0EE19_9TELE|nr:hypothetical protein NHX12_028837 [Muraenolepis orangiensis]
MSRFRLNFDPQETPIVCGSGSIGCRNAVPSPSAGTPGTAGTTGYETRDEVPHNVAGSEPILRLEGQLVSWQPGRPGTRGRKEKNARPDLAHYNKGPMARRGISPDQGSQVM